MGAQSLELARAAALSPREVLEILQSQDDGLSAEEAARRIAVFGANAVADGRARPLALFVRQLRNPLLVLLLGTAVASAFVGEVADTTIIFLISALSIGLGFANEYRSERALQTLQSQVRYTTLAVRNGSEVALDVSGLVPGDVVQILAGDVVPADLRLLEAAGLEIDEAILTGESLPAEKRVEPTASPTSALDLRSCAFFGTIVRAGKGRGVVVATGRRTAVGAVARALAERRPDTTFELGLRDFSFLLVRVTTVLAFGILVADIAIGRSVLTSTLFALAIAVGLTPQLLPAIVTVSLSTGAKRLARRSVVVRRLVAIEDLGNIDVLFTDKTGTLTEGQIRLSRAFDAAGSDADEVLELALLCSDAVVADHTVIRGDAIDTALWKAPAAASLNLGRYRRVAVRPFDYERRFASVVVVSAADEAMAIVKGAPEVILERCIDVPAAAQSLLEREFETGARVVAVATKTVNAHENVTDNDEQGLDLAGFLSFDDPPKAEAAQALARLESLQIEVKIVTGDNSAVAVKVCEELGIPVRGILTGAELDHMDDAGLASLLPNTTIFARVTPTQKARVIEAQRTQGATVAFLGDGVNDAVALHGADVGISVQDATDVAKDAADLVMLAKDLGVLADSVVEGRRIFENTTKYVLMGTSSNFGNVFSAGAASLFLSFLPLLPTQILLNNLLYDVSELAIPTDNVDREQLRAPSHWDPHLIRRFMMFFGPISSAFDFATFAILLLAFHANATLFRSGWFVESLATQALAIVSIRTRRFLVQSRPSRPLLLSTAAVVAAGFALPYSPLAHPLGFTALPAGLVLAVAAIIPAYLILLEAAKWQFYRRQFPVEIAASGRPPRQARRRMRLRLDVAHGRRTR